MLLLTIVIGFLSPFTAFAINAVSLPSIKLFRYTFVDLINGRGKNLEIFCEASGTPRPIIEYQLNNIVLRNSSRVKIKNNILTIKNASYGTDEGKYKCVATNIHGRVFKEKFIQIETVGHFLTGNTIQDKLKYIYVTLGHPVEIQCPEHTKTHPVRYFWGSAGPTHKRLQESQRINILDNGILHIASVTREDVNMVNKKYGGISCILYSQGIRKYSVKLALVVEDVYTGDIAPRVYKPLPRSIYLKEGESKTLHCYASGNPMPDITWFRNGEQINTNDSKFGVNPFQPGKLTIKSYKGALAGQYKCQLTNRAGKANTFTDIYTAIPPTILRNDEVIVIARNQRIDLSCQSTGTKPLTYQWYRNGRLISSYTSPNASMIIEENKLSINFINYNHAGTYQCFVYNKYGEASLIFPVSVKEPKVQKGLHKDGNGDNVIEVTPVETKPVKQDKTKSKTSNFLNLETKYIIIIACGSAVFILVVGGGIVMYCRTKDDKRDVIFIPSPQRHHIDVVDPNRALYADVRDLPPPPSSLTNYSDEDLSLYGDSQNGKHQEFITLMSDIRSREQGKEHFYYDIPDIKYQNHHPSTEL